MTLEEALEVTRIYRALYQVDSKALSQAFDDLVRLYYGQFPGYARCDTQYHDVQHVMDVTLAMARLLDGYERSRGDARQRQPADLAHDGFVELYGERGTVRHVHRARHRRHDCAHGQRDLQGKQQRDRGLRLGGGLERTSAVHDRGTCRRHLPGDR